MKISFDFDGTLSQLAIQELAKVHLTFGHEIWIVTARTSSSNWNFDLKIVANNLGIPHERIHYTEGSYKWQFLEDNGFDIHFDDDYMEIETARKNHCKCTFIPIFDPLNI